MVNSKKPEDLILRLYLNGEWKEAEFAGYREVKLEPRRWTYSEDYSEVAYPAVVFESAMLQPRSESVIGYFVTLSSGEIVWAEDLPSPILMKYPGTQIEIVLKLKVKMLL